MRLLAIDPGNTQSAFVLIDTELEKNYQVVDFDKIDNHVLIDGLSGIINFDAVVIEMIACYGMAVGESVFETVFWIGRFFQQCEAKRITPDRLKRMEVKMHLCRNSRAKDGNVRQALIDRFGPPGTKKAPGALYGVSGDVWAALAVAVTWMDLRAEKDISDGK